MAKDDSSPTTMWIVGTLSVMTGVFLGLALKSGADKLYGMLLPEESAVVQSSLTSDEVVTG